jgi:autotransporter-associated beta strand protein
LQSFNNGGSNLDFNVARGGSDFLKDLLVPALWMNDSSGDWNTLANWNSGQTPIAPVQGPGQVARVGTLIMPTPRLPGAAGSGVTSGQHDTVILERPNANITVTFVSGTQSNIRKLYVREALNITGGLLTVSYVPSADSTPYGARFSGPVALNGGVLSVHTLQVDAAETFTLNSGGLTLNTLYLMPGATPAKMLMGGDVTFSPLATATATIANGTGSGSSGFIDLGGANRSFHVINRLFGIDLSIDVPVSNGGIIKTDAGELRLTAANTYNGGTIVSGGTLFVNNTTGSGTGTGGVTVNSGTLAGTGSVAGVVNVNSGGTVAPGLLTTSLEASIGTLTMNSLPVFNGFVLMEINRNGGSPLSDRIVLTGGTLNYGGTLVVSNAGAALVGGEVFTLFTAPAYSGAFAATFLPTLGSGLNWHIGGLTANGSIRVNRQPVANSPLTFTNTAPSVLEISFATLAANAADPDGTPLTLVGINLTTTNGVTLTTNSTTVFYSNHQTVNDQFSYTITDGQGGTATGLVNIVNIGSAPLAQFSCAPSPNGTSVLLHFEATPGWTYYLERSTNLLDWKPIWTNVAAPSVFDYTDGFQDLNGPPTTAFYRLSWSP